VFGQDRVNFHQNPGRDTAGWAEPTWTNRAGYSIPCVVMLGSGGEVAGEAIAPRESAGKVRVVLSISLFVLYILFISIVVVTVPFVCCSVKLPLSRPTSFLPVSFHSPPHPHGGRDGRATEWAFCCWPRPNYNNTEYEINCQLASGTGEF